MRLVKTKVQFSGLFIVLLILFLVFLNGCTSEISAKRVYDKNMNSIGKIVTNTGFGSAFVIDKNKGLIITNYHVISGSSDIRYVTNRNKIIDVLGVLYANSDWDVAILLIESIEEDEVSFEYKSSSVGEKIYVISSPMGDYINTLSEGIISSIRSIGNNTYYQHNASIFPGSSGGAIFNSKGKVIGVINMGIEQTDINFAIIADEKLKDLINKYKKIKEVDLINYILDLKNYTNRFGDVEEGQFIGEITEYYSDGVLKYKGFMKNGEYHGEGKLLNRKEYFIYDGFFNNGQKDGEGSLYEYYGNPTLLYKGEFKENKFNGVGIEYYKKREIDDHYYSDENDENRKFNRAYTIGLLDEEKITSFGWKSIYEYRILHRILDPSEFNAKRFEELGVSYIRPGITELGRIKYEGDFNNGLFNGEGKHYNILGELVYEGEFKNGQFHGNGKEYGINKEIVYDGIWQNGKKIGQ